jgi:hypothetical protein
VKPPTGTPEEIARAYMFARMHLEAARLAFFHGDPLAALAALQNAEQARHFARALRRWRNRRAS